MKIIQQKKIKTEITKRLVKMKFIFLIRYFPKIQILYLKTINL